VREVREGEGREGKTPTYLMTAQIGPFNSTPTGADVTGRTVM